jgi:hypothetical protein
MQEMEVAYVAKNRDTEIKTLAGLPALLEA